MNEWMVMYAYLAATPERIVGDSDSVMSQLQAVASAKTGKAIGELEYEFMTDQIDVFFQRKGRRRRFAVLMA